MSRVRIITARLKFSARKHGRDMTEAELANYLGAQLEFADGLDVETVLDGDPMKGAMPALRRAESFIAGFEDDPLQEGIPELLAEIRAAIAGAPADPVRDAAYDTLAALKVLVEALAMCEPRTRHGADCAAQAMLAGRAAIAKAEGRS